jgi:hypothetical protein
MLENIARLHVVLNGITPEIWRRIEVPVSVNLHSLHSIVQSAMGWLDYHSYEFTVGDKVYGTPGDDWQYRKNMRRAHCCKLAKLVADNVRTFHYQYDFGDRWWHTITVESVTSADVDVGFPRLIGGMRRCPPEDVGGPDGYEAFVRAIADPNDEEHDSWIEWYDGFEWYDRPYDPDDINAYSLRLRLGDIARRHVMAMRACETRMEAKRHTARRSR